ncbi:putative 3-methyladenine DNA glycosylase [Sphaerisporangium melleum]|uniref:Putative 3-methyladenine DNA glycosylase n=1 Tax=Sphaerisporangium melleum TaxID=321316 RepID=A0A917R2Y8_9ACTN|nr:DNA-3-methyladenine glycosylase [Sphaerisporangium melleum]GGK86796.1 putative 3-methyladenine DNA glycosylase [Sphaerisporangium melleum]GII72324.1 putative 3-methyladenine DNA glycosylase [Sphaerisporangium melleum]
MGERIVAGQESGSGGPITVAGPAAQAGGRVLDRAFFDRPAPEVAPELLGRVLVHGPVAVRLTEVEAYGPPGEDPASHTYRGRTPRNAVMFGPPGHLYVYFTYGMHYCANFVCLPEGLGSGVLLRAGEVISGVETARTRRHRPGTAGPLTAPGRAVPARDLARGPARLAVALGIGREHNGADCCSESAPEGLLVLEGDPAGAGSVRSGPRTGVSSAADIPWRFWIDGDPSVSPYRKHVPRTRPT